MIDLLDTVRELKTMAKNRRDLELYTQGIDFAKDAIDKLIEGLGSAPEDRRAALEAEVADCWGLVGGIERRQGLAPGIPEEERANHLRASARAYDEGDKYERLDSVVNSYNLVNRLISRILAEPRLLAEPPADVECEEMGPAAMKAALEEAAEIIATQLVLDRRGDPWAMADQALVRILLREPQLDAESALRQFRKSSPADYAYESVLSTLEPLSALDLPMASILEEAVQLLVEDLELM